MVMTWKIYICMNGMLISYIKKLICSKGYSFFTSRISSIISHYSTYIAKSY